MTGAEIALALGVVQGGIGAIQNIGAQGKMKKLFKQRKAFQTPQEVFDILNMTLNNAQSGLSPETLQYLTGGADRALGAGLGTARRLGADPNQLATQLDSYFQDIFRIGGENEMQKMKKFDSVLNATKLVAENKEAEWASRDNLIKDQLQMYASKAQGGAQNLQSGINTGLSALSSIESENLWKELLKPKPQPI